MPRPGNLWVTLAGMAALKFTTALVDSGSNDVASLPGTSLFRSQFFLRLVAVCVVRIDRLVSFRHRVSVGPIGPKGPSSGAAAARQEFCCFAEPGQAARAGGMRSAQQA